MLIPAVERGAIGNIERRIARKTLRQIGVGEVQLAEGDQIEVGAKDDKLFFTAKTPDPEPEPATP